MKKIKEFLKTRGILQDIYELYEDKYSDDPTLDLNAFTIQIYVYTFLQLFPKFPLELLLNNVPSEYEWLKVKLRLLYSGRRMFDWKPMLDEIRENEKIPCEDVKDYNQLFCPVRVK